MMVSLDSKSPFINISAADKRKLSSEVEFKNLSSIVIMVSLQGIAHTVDEWLYSAFNPTLALLIEFVIIRNTGDQSFSLCSGLC
jgi:hypothetical protein